MKTNKAMLVGVLCAACCALCVALYLIEVRGEVDEARAEALARYGGEQIEVCVAKRDLAAGEVVDEGSIATKLWVADLLPEGSVTDPSRIVGQRLGSTIYKGEVICDRRTETSQTALNVPEGKAAISVPAQAVQAVGGSVEPGMAVDVYATGPAATTPLVQGALVLASSATAEDTASSSSDWITLAVDPERVQEVVAAAQNLELYFVLPAAATAPPSASEEPAAPQESTPDEAQEAPAEAPETQPVAPTPPSAPAPPAA